MSLQNDPSVISRSTAEAALKPGKFRGKEAGVSSATTVSTLEYHKHRLTCEVIGERSGSRQLPAGVDQGSEFVSRDLDLQA